MIYNKTTYVDGVTPINGENLNKAEIAIEEISRELENAKGSNVNLGARLDGIDASLDDNTNALEEHLANHPSGGGGGAETHEHLNKVILDSITGEKIAQWDNNSMEVIDDLNSENASYALSANQGRILKNKTEELSASLEDIANKGTTVEVLERVTKEEIDRQVADGTIANLTIENRSLGMLKTDFFLVNMHNLFDKTRVTPGVVTGDDLNTDIRYLKTNYFIEVDPNTKYALKGTSGDVGYWDKSKKYITRGGSGNIVITTPENCYYMKITTTPSMLETCMMVKGETVPSEYSEYGTYSVDIPDIELKKSIGKTVSSDILDKNMPPIRYEHTDFMEKKYFNILNENESEIGIISTSGQLVANESYRASGFMRIEAGKAYKCTRQTWDCCYFDKYKNPTRSANGFATNNPPQVGDCYIRITYSKNNIGNIMFGEADRLPEQYEPFGRYEVVYKNEYDASSLSKQFKKYILESPLMGKKWCVIGDSISDTLEGRGRTKKFYQEYIQDETGVELFNWNGNGTGYAKPFMDKLAIKDRLDDIPLDSDIITILAGTNDSIGLGQFGDIEPTTFYGAVDYVVRSIIERFPTISFGVMTILPKQSDSDRLNGGVRKYSNAIIEVCEKYCVPVLNLYDEVGFNPKNEVFRTTMMPDGLHPNELGHKRMAKKIKHWLETL